MASSSATATGSRRDDLRGPIQVLQDALRIDQALENSHCLLVRDIGFDCTAAASGKNLSL